MDKADPSLVLEGATFILQDTQGKRPEVTLTTDAAGKAFSRSCFTAITF
ncbi:hypothetical protein AB4124_14075 [Paenibacillus sp. 2KB_20]